MNKYATQYLDTPTDAFDFDVTGRLWLPTSKAAFDNMHVLYANNRKKFAKILGKHAFVWKTEYSYRVWLVQFEDCPYYIFSAAGKGTDYERPTGKKNVARDCRFIRWILAELKAA